jgi:hypothetical protein
VQTPRLADGALLTSVPEPLIAYRRSRFVRHAPSMIPDSAPLPFVLAQTPSSVDEAQPYPSSPDLCLGIGQAAFESDTPRNPATTALTVA